MRPSSELAAEIWRQNEVKDHQPAYSCSDTQSRDAWTIILGSGMRLK